MNRAAVQASPMSANELDAVESRTMIMRDVRLEKGATLPQVQVAYETYGALDPSGRNAVLMTHGYTGSGHAAGRNAPGRGAPGVVEGSPGWWFSLVGPGKPIDTKELFVVASNMLGSSFGTTGPASIDPRTGKPYGPDFPEITLKDMVLVQKRLLEELGVKHLVAVAGPSFGGYQAFQWSVQHPDFMDGVVVAVSAPKGAGGEEAVQSLVRSLAKDPSWNGGRYYENGGIGQVMTDIRVATLRRYGVEEVLAATIPDQAAREEQLRKMAGIWAKAFDGNSLVVLRRAAVNYNAEKDFSKIKAKVLYVLSTTDKLFPPSIGPGVMEKLKAAGVDATFFELKSQKGHMAAEPDAALWAPTLRAFMDGLTSKAH